MMKKVRLPLDLLPKRRLRVTDDSLKKLSLRVGKYPGYLSYQGEHKIGTTFTHSHYNNDIYDKEDFVDAAPIRSSCTAEEVHWIDVIGLHDTEKLKRLFEDFNIHPLLQEDIVDTEQLPKAENFGEHFFLTLKMLSIDKESQEVVHEHLSFILGDHYVFTFQEMPGDVFTDIRHRLERRIGKIRQRPVDYLFTQLIDSVIDHYFAVFEEVRSSIEQLELHMLHHKKKDLTNQLIEIRKDIIQLRKWVMPLREAILHTRRSETKLIRKEWKHYLDDTADQLEHVIQEFESFREMLNYLMDLNFSNLTNETNEIVKTLTIISAIFIPLTFLAGLYGMNFKYIPELEYRNGYFILLGVMAVVFLLSIYAFKRRNWL